MKNEFDSRCCDRYQPRYFLCVLCVCVCAWFILHSPLLPSNLSHIHTHQRTSTVSVRLLRFSYDFFLLSNSLLASSLPLSSLLLILCVVVFVHGRVCVVYSSIRHSNAKIENIFKHCYDRMSNTIWWIKIHWKNIVVIPIFSYQTSLYTFFVHTFWRW